MEVIKINPILLPLILLALIWIWTLLAFLYKPLGKFVRRIWGDALEEMTGSEINRKDNNTDDGKDELKDE